MHSTSRCHSGIRALALFFFAAPAWAQSTPASLIAEGHYRRAEAIVRAELAKQPQDVTALVELSIVLWSYGDLDKAEATAAKAVSIEDGSAAAHAQLVNILGAELASKKAGAMEKMSLSHRFRKEAERTLQLDPNNIYATEALARYSWYAPMIAGGDKSKAMRIVDRVIQMDSTRGYTLKAELDTTQDAGKALADWKQAAAAKSDSYQAHVGLGKALLHAGGESWKSAEEEGRKALAVDSSREPAYVLLATVYATTQQWQRLDAILREAHSAVPDDDGAEFAAAQIILDKSMQTEFSRAEAYFKNYLNTLAEGLEPNLAMAHWQLGLLLEKEGHRSTALHEVQTAASLDPSLDGAKHDAKRLQ